MFRNYLVTLYRNLAGKPLYAFINIVGLSIGLALFVSAQLITSYERNYDDFFPNSGNIYAVYGIFQPDAGVGVRTSIGSQSKVAPLIKSDIHGVSYVARSLTREYLARHEDLKYYQSIRFVDPDFLKIFQFNYVSGDAEKALDNPDGLIITRSSAEKYFGEESALGKVIRVKNKHDLYVTAVIEDLPLNSHFSSSIISDTSMQMIATTAVLEKISDFQLEGNWYNMSSSDITYVLLQEASRVSDIDQQLDKLYEEHVPERYQRFLAGFELRALTRLNLYPWETTGLPVMASIDILGFLILIIAIFNYTNLSTAQLLGRTREVGLRRVMGASRWQMFSQFLAESTVLAAFALLLALGIITSALPVLNDISGKGVSLAVLAQPLNAVYMLLLVLGVGCLAGCYPAWLISRGNTIQLLNGSLAQGRRSELIRNAMLVAQFSIALFMIMGAGIIYTQNQMLERSGQLFDRDHIVTLERMSRDEIQARIDVLRNEFTRLPGVRSFTVSNQVPFEQEQSSGNFGHTAGDKANSMELYRMSIDTGFIRTYDLELLAGRNFSKAYTDDILLVDEDKNPIQDRVNTIVNEATLRVLGFSVDDALGKHFYRYVEDGPTVEYRIVGVMADTNFLAFHNELKPIVFVNRPENQRIGSLKIQGRLIPETLAAIDRIWETQVPEFPIERKFLDDHFNDMYRIFRGINLALVGFASMAIVVASIGLFGMAAFMAERRTREIGVRKVLGASIADIMRLLLLQFSKPVLIAICIASPLAWVAAGLYLNFFAERTEFPLTLLLASAFATLVLAWLTVASHAMRVARANPILALRYE